VTPTPLRVILVAVLVVLGLTGCGDDDATETMTVGALLADPVVGEIVTVEGTVSLLGELFCPCFELGSGGATVAVWYDLMVGDDENWDPVDVSGVANGDTVVVEGALRTISPTTDTPPEMWATSISVTSSEGGLANPASEYCEEQGGTVDIRDGETGQIGYCVFPDGSECEEWAYYRGECEPGG
jgi:putative hemolysin